MMMSPEEFAVHGVSELKNEVRSLKEAISQINSKIASMERHIYHLNQRHSK